MPTKKSSGSSKKKRGSKSSSKRKSSRTKPAKGAPRKRSGAPASSGASSTTSETGSSPTTTSSNLTKWVAYDPETGNRGHVRSNLEQAEADAKAKGWPCVAAQDDDGKHVQAQMARQ
jgi:hypothetical protein